MGPSLWDASLPETKEAQSQASFKILFKKKC